MTLLYDLQNPLRLMPFAGIITSALLLSATQLLLLGVLGEYVGRIYLGISEKPQSVVRERFSSSRSDPAQS